MGKFAYAVQLSPGAGEESPGDVPERAGQTAALAMTRLICQSGNPGPRTAGSFVFTHERQ